MVQETELVLPDFAKLTDEQLERYLRYHRPASGIGTPDYLTALECRDQRQAKGLSFKKTLEVVSRAAADGKYVSYGEVAAHSGIPWKTAKWPMPKHLGRLCEYAYRRGWPLLSSIVVNRQHLDTGDLEAASLSGFIKAARDLGFLITDQKAFLRDQQQRVFEWGRTHRQE